VRRRSDRPVRSVALSTWPAISPHGPERQSASCGSAAAGSAEAIRDGLARPDAPAGKQALMQGRTRGNWPVVLHVRACQAGACSWTGRQSASERADERTNAELSAGSSESIWKRIGAETKDGALQAGGGWSGAGGAGLRNKKAPGGGTVPTSASTTASATTARGPFRISLTRFDRPCHDPAMPFFLPQRTDRGVAGSACPDETSNGCPGQGNRGAITRQDDNETQQRKGLNGAKKGRRRGCGRREGGEGGGRRNEANDD